MTDTQTVIVGVRIAQADMQRLDREAASRGTTRSAWVMFDARVMSLYSSLVDDDEGDALHGHRPPIRRY